MDYLKANFDRVLLLVAGLLLAVVAVFAVMGRGALASDFPAPSAETAAAPFEPSPEIALLAAEEAKLAEPAKVAWMPPEDGGSLFVSRIYLLGETGLVDLYHSNLQLFEGIPNEWLLKHNLDYTDKQLATKDPDNDGFNNLEECLGGTDPNSARSTPATWSKLRLVSSQRDKLRLRFMSLPKGTLDEVAINTMSPDDPSKLSGSTQFYPRTREEVRTAEGEVKVDRSILLLAGRGAGGEEIFEVTPFKFRRAEWRKDPATGEETPVVILLNEVDDQPLEFELKREEIKDSPFPLATLQDSRPGGSSWTLRSGKEFELDGRNYKLIDVSGETATIRDLSSREEIHVSAEAATLKPASDGEKTTNQLDPDATAKPPSE